MRGFPVKLSRAMAFAFAVNPFSAHVTRLSCSSLSPQRALLPGEPRSLCVSMAGFGAKPPPSGKAAKRVLKKTGEDIDAAYAMLFQENMRKIKSSEPDVYRRMQKEIFDARRGISQPSDAVHELLVEATWDTIASFLPVTRTSRIDRGVAGRLETIAKACLPVKNARILDVGCGDGSIVQYIKKAGGQEEMCTGLDLSGEMIDTAKAAYRRATFRKANFMKFKPGAVKYDTILFNGSLQFFPCIDNVLRQASIHLTERGRIVVAHVNGAAFVRDEKTKNPVTVISTMPTLQCLQREVEKLRLEILDANDFEARSSELDQFYLVVLRKV